MRTDENFELSDGKYTFLKEKTSLLNIPHFSLVTSLPPCTAHNLFSTGAFSRDLVHILNKLLIGSSFNIKMLNQNLINISKLLPNVFFSLISEEKICGKMHDQYMLIIYLPFAIMYNNIDKVHAISY